MYNSIWVMLHKFSVFSMFLNWWLLDFASCVCVGVCVCVCVCVLAGGWEIGTTQSLDLLRKWCLTGSLSI